MSALEVSGEAMVAVRVEVVAAEALVPGDVVLVCDIGGGTTDFTLIEITDDGAGFDVAARAAADGHFGIRGMQERARRIGGRLTIHSNSGLGTRVTLAMGNGPATLEGTLVPRTPG
jgi:two-component sensor histidine kinase